MSYKVLLVEDEKRMQEIIKDYFEVKECEVICASDGIEALEILESKSFDLVLLDIMMPKLDGFSVCEKIRKDKIESSMNSSDIPIIFITARSDEDDNLYGYKLGADDYITKPFSLKVLYAKCSSVIKRAKGIIVEDKLYADEISVDCKTHRVYINEEEVLLPKMEYDLLCYFIVNKNRIIEREQLLIKFWGYDFDGNDRVLDTHIKKLRKALGESAYHLHTIVKVGYKFEVINDEG
ncbi:DNA-binding response regulator [Clostridium gelidum]|uniref:Stage 0 sporulation protein A homolog n=1 Tax=Clostridium gelidum TaxID=704125 RepID=A0ABM7SYL3_9CLOT|nr:response regulator transcription factor [Clostridium gelidum]BCZ44722.1 DNA-binding response regulator [Clostridium gelidum]